MHRRALFKLLAYAPFAAFLPTAPPVRTTLFVGEDSFYRARWKYAVISQKKYVARVRITGDAMRAIWKEHTPTGSFAEYARREALLSSAPHSREWFGVS
jgi:hypothetical protein